MTDVDERLAAVERRLAAIEHALATMGPQPAARAAAPTPKPEARLPPPLRPPGARPPRSRRLPEAPALELEDLLGGRVLAWVGGVAVVLGVVFFLVMAVSRGWIDEPTRVVLAFAGSTALLAVGLYLYERRGQTEAAVAAVAAALASLYASLTVATNVYDLLDPVLGLAVAALVGAAGAAIAVRWGVAVVGWLAILGALASPILVGAGTSNSALAFMAVALVSATAVLVWQRWGWLAAGAFLVSAPQLVQWVDGAEGIAVPLVVVTLFWGLYAVAAVGYELRVPVSRLRFSSALLLLANALLAGGLGYHVVTDEPLAARTAWILWLSLVHVVVGGAGFRQRMSKEIAALLIAIGIAFSALALALALDGPALVAGWSAEAAVLALVASRTRDRRAFIGTAAFLGLAAAHTLSFEAPPDSLLHGADGLGRALLAVLCVAAAALVAAALYEGEPREARVVFAIAGASALVYAPSLAIVDLTGAQAGVEPGQTPQVFLSAFWSLVGLGAIVAGLVRDVRPLRLAGLALLGAAVLKVFAYDLAELDEIFRVLSFVALGLLLLTGAFAYQRLRAGRP